MIYFDNAATTFPKPEETVRAMNAAMRCYGANPGRSGHRLSLVCAEKVYECRERAARLFGCPQPENVVFTANCAVTSFPSASFTTAVPVTSDVYSPASVPLALALRPSTV